MFDTDILCKLDPPVEIPRGKFSGVSDLSPSILLHDDIKLHLPFLYTSSSSFPRRRPPTTTAPRHAFAPQLFVSSRGRWFPPLLKN
ncbi:hypothetical protein RIF29_22001 [Crotalaria pallida]|uniref:Uncharacterized protein n=1 Tax=Crotalaria pallida TaxID=3830 RepID=A0AAN9F448_CROPI